MAGFGLLRNQPLLTDTKDRTPELNRRKLLNPKKIAFILFLSAFPANKHTIHIRYEKNLEMPGAKCAWVKFFYPRPGKYIRRQY